MRAFGSARGRRPPAMVLLALAPADLARACAAETCGGVFRIARRWERQERSGRPRTCSRPVVDRSSAFTGPPEPAGLSCAYASPASDVHALVRHERGRRALLRRPRLLRGVHLEQFACLPGGRALL